MTKKVVVFLITCMLVIIVGACSKDDPTGSNGDGNGNGTGLPDFTAMAVSVPTEMQNAAGSNPGVANGVALITMANSFVAYSAFMIPVGAPKIAAPNDGSYSWTVGDLTITMTVTTVDSYTNWTVSLNGSDGEQTYEDFILLSGSSQPDGSVGELLLYAPEAGNQEVLSWSWMTGQTGIFSIDYFAFDASSAVTVEVNPDGTGVVINRVQTLSVYSASWNTDGSGSYNYYNSQGDVIDSGTW